MTNIYYVYDLYKKKIRFFFYFFRLREKVLQIYLLHFYRSKYVEYKKTIMCENKHFVYKEVLTFWLNCSFGPLILAESQK